MYKFLICVISIILIITYSCELNDPGEPTYDNIYKNRNSTVCDNGNRGKVLFNEILWAGSYENNGIAHKDDVFIELYNDDFKEINLSSWNIIIEGDFNKTYLIPSNKDNPPIIKPSSFLVIAKTRDFAFPKADIIIPNLKIPRENYKITLKDCDLRLIESIGIKKGESLAGSDDLRSSRSMERTEDRFDNDGYRDSSWHTYCETNVNLDIINTDFSDRTFASPGVKNSADYGIVPDISNPDDTLN